MPTPEQISAAIEADPAVKEISDLVVELVDAAGPTGKPLGHLYAVLMGHLSLDQFNTFVAALIATGRLRREGLLVFKRKPE